MNCVVPISAIVATRDRSASFTRLLRSLAQQSVQPSEMIIIDGSTSDETQKVCKLDIPNLKTRIACYQAYQIGAAAQRNQAVQYVSQQYLLFMDDDIVFEPDCIQRLWHALRMDRRLGGVNAMITNQQYLHPGLTSRLVFRLLHGKNEASYAGMCIGPGLNLLPEDNPNLPDVVPTEWLNTTCVLYRREALPDPPFSDNFIGYSMMEDLALSLLVRNGWNLANARTARIYHDSQPGEHKGNTRELARMELVNRHYVMTNILEQTKLQDYLKLVLLEIFNITSEIRTKGWQSTLPILQGKLAGCREILK